MDPVLDTDGGSDQNGRGRPTMGNWVMVIAGVMGGSTSQPAAGTSVVASFLVPETRT